MARRRTIMQPINFKLKHVWLWTIINMWLYTTPIADYSAKIKSSIVQSRSSDKMERNSSSWDGLSFSKMPARYINSSSSNGWIWTWLVAFTSLDLCVACVVLVTAFCCMLATWVWVVVVVVLVVASSLLLTSWTDDYIEKESWLWDCTSYFMLEEQYWKTESWHWGACK